MAEPREDATTETEAARAPTGAADRTAYDVPAGESAETCPDCGRPFPDASLLALHRGLAHDQTLSDEDREAVETARETEQRQLRLFRLKAIAVLVVLYFGLLMLYAVVT